MFSFIIRTKNEARFLGRVLESIKIQLTEEQIEVVVVDSGSIDDTLSIAEKYNCKIVKLSEQDFTWGYALNLGISNAGGNYIGIISGHCILTDQFFIENAINIFEQHGNVMAIYGQQKALQNMDPFEEVDLEYHYPERELDIFVKESKEHTGISNACSIIRREAWEQLQYDEKVQSCEDGIWGEEILDRGYALAYTSQIGVFHSHQLDTAYLYKKYFWREYCPQYNKEHPHNFIYNFMKFYIKNMCVEYKFYKKGFLRNNILCSKRNMLMFLLVRNAAMGKAAFLLSRKTTTELKYEDIIVPRYILKFQEKLNGIFWTYFEEDGDK